MEWIDAQAGNGAERSRVWERRALISGVLYGVVAILGAVFAMLFIFPDMASPDAPPAERVVFFIEHGERMLTGTYLLMLQVPLMLVFLGGLFARMRRAEGGSGVLSLIALGAGLVMTSMLYMGWMIAGNITTFIAEEGGNPATVSAMDALAPMSLALSAFPRAILIGAVSFLVLERGIAPRWIGVSGLVLAAIHLAGTLTLVIGDIFPVLALASLVYTIWIMALSVSVLRRTVPAPQTVGQPLPA